MSFLVCTSRSHRTVHLLICAQSSTFEQSATAAQHKRVMPTTQITATILLFARRVSQQVFCPWRGIDADRFGSVRQRHPDRRDQEDHQGERNHEVRIERFSCPQCPI
jgi:hypothetical protein